MKRQNNTSLTSRKKCNHLILKFVKDTREGRLVPVVGQTELMWNPLKIPYKHPQKFHKKIKLQSLIKDRVYKKTKKRKKREGGRKEEGMKEGQKEGNFPVPGTKGKNLSV